MSEQPDQQRDTQPDEQRRDLGAEEPGNEAGVDPQAQPVAGGSDEGEPAQGEGAPDSW